MRCYNKGNEIGSSTENNLQGDWGAPHRQQFITGNILPALKRGLLYQQFHLEGETVGGYQKKTPWMSSATARRGKRKCAAALITAMSSVFTTATTPGCGSHLF